MAERPPAGLKSIRAGRDDRLRGRYSRPTTKLLLAAIAGVSVTLIGYDVYTTRAVESRKADLLGKQHAVQQAIGGEWDALRDRLESATLSAAQAYAGDVAPPHAMTSDFRSRPGLYLRLRVADARNTTRFRQAVDTSQRDAFAACFLHEQPTPSDEADGGLFAEQPWNLRRAYVATRILTDKWVSDVKAADDDLRLRVFEQQYEHAAKDEIPLTVRIVKEAEYLLLVLDEDPSPVEAAGATADSGTSDVDVQASAHSARVELIDLTAGASSPPLFRLRRNAEASYVMVSESETLAPEIQLALKRQVNNCALANEITKALALGK